MARKVLSGIERDILKAEAERRVRAGEARAEVARVLRVHIQTLAQWALMGGWRRKDIMAAQVSDLEEAASRRIAEGEAAMQAERSARGQALERSRWEAAQRGPVRAKSGGAGREVAQTPLIDLSDEDAPWLTEAEREERDRLQEERKEADRAVIDEAIAQLEALAKRVEKQIEEEGGRSARGGTGRFGVVLTLA